MGRYDDILAGLPQPAASAQAPVRPTGKYDDILAGLPKVDNRSTLEKVLGAGKEALKMAPTAATAIAGLAGAGNPWDAASVVNAPELMRRVKEGSVMAGEGVAEQGGKMLPNHPNIPAAIGTAVAMAPELVAAGTTLRGMVASQDPLAQAIRNTPKDLSPRYAALNKEAGISENLPVQRGSIPRFPGLDGQPQGAPPPQAPTVAPVAYPKDPNAFLNFAKARLSGLGDKLSAQELNDYKSIVNTMMRTGKVSPGTDQYAVASQVGKQTTQLLNKAVPGRAELDQVYALSKQLRIAPEIAKRIWDYFGPKLRWGAGVVGVP